MSKTFFFLCVFGFILYSTGFGKYISGELYYFSLPCVDMMTYAHSAVVVLRVLLLFLMNSWKVFYRYQFNAQLLYCIENGHLLQDNDQLSHTHKITPGLPSAGTECLKESG